jgi:hypothetical protein
MHCSAQGPLQQTPSTQNPDRHWLASRQASPLPIWPHEPPWHWFCPSQSDILLHVSAQRLPSDLHLNGAQASGAPVGAQCPCPSQRISGCTMSSLLSQVALAHTVSGPYSWHCPAPSHRPLVAQLDAGCLGQSPCTGGLARGIATQVPRLSGRLQARQASLQSWLQQTPSAQLPLAQSPPV